MTISREKYILTVLGEECAEVAKIASKAVRFGLDSHHPGKPEIDNRQLLIEELNDIMAMVWELNENYGLGFSLNRRQQTEKRAKVDKYYTQMYGGPSMPPPDMPPDPPKENKMEVPTPSNVVDAFSKTKAA